MLGRILVAGALAVHLVVGCCGHHTHLSDNGLALENGSALATGGGATPSFDPKQNDGCLRGHARCSEPHDVHSHHGDHSHHGPHDCQGFRCAFVLSSRSPVDTTLWSLDACPIRLPDDQARLVDVRPVSFSPSLLRPELPVPLYLAHSVLVI